MGALSSTKRKNRNNGIIQIRIISHFFNSSRILEVQTKRFITSVITIKRYDTISFNTLSIACYQSVYRIIVIYKTAAEVFVFSDDVCWRMLTCADICDHQDLWIGMPGCHDSRIVKERKPRVLNEANTEITIWNNRYLTVQSEKIITGTFKAISKNFKLTIANLVSLPTILFAAMIYQMMSKEWLQRALYQEIYSSNIIRRSFEWRTKCRLSLH